MPTTTPPPPRLAEPDRDGDHPHDPHAAPTSGEDSDPGVDAIVESPLCERLCATRAGQSYTIDATRSVGAAWARMNAFLDELERILTDPDLDRDVVDEAA